VRSRRAILADLQRVDDEINALYWTFTRTARGKPPCVVRPELYPQRTALRQELAAWYARRRRRLTR